VYHKGGRNRQWYSTVRTPFPRQPYPDALQKDAPHDLRAAGLLGVGFSASLDALEQALTVLVELELGDLDLAGSDANGDRLAVSLLAGDTLDVDDIFQTVDRNDLALTSLVRASCDDNFVVFSDRKSADIVFLTEFLGKRRAHNRAAHAGRGTEVRLARLSSRRGEAGIDLRHVGGFEWTTRAWAVL